MKLVDDRQDVREGIMNDDGIKRKRDGSEDSLNNHLQGQLQPIMAISSAASPLHTPSPSSSAFPASTNGNGYGNGAENGSGSRRNSEKIMRRNIDRVLFGAYDIKTWYYSPYPFDEEEWASITDGNGSTSQPLSALTRGNRVESRNFSPGTPSSTRESSLSRLGGALSNSVDKAPALQALDVEAPLINRKEFYPPPAKALWVCDGCFKYMRTYGGYTVHKKDCKQTHPPGKKVYQRGAHIIWEVDGLREKLYAQNLSLFGKLFIDHKTIYFDVEPFIFYVLTDATSQFDHVLGFFSKEKVSYDDYNLACIITFPPFQKKGYGTLMIEFSYYLSSLTTTLGTPERPLSDLGFKGYLSYWCAVVLRTLALFFYDQKPSILNCLLPASQALPTLTRHKTSAQTIAGNIAVAEARQRRETLRIRKALIGQGQEKDDAAKVEESLLDNSKLNVAKRMSKGWAGEMQWTSESSADHKAVSLETDIPAASSHAVIIDPLLELTATSFETTLDRLSQATNLRLEDLCYAMAEIGLLSTAKANDASEEIKTITISQEIVRKAIEYNRIKRPILDVNYILVKEIAR